MHTAIVPGWELAFSKQIGLILPNMIGPKLSGER